MTIKVEALPRTGERSNRLASKPESVMNTVSPRKSVRWCAIVLAGVFVASLAPAQDQAPSATPVPQGTNVVVAAIPPTTGTPPAPKLKLTGAELYSIHCNRCHPERYPTERTAAQWKTIMLHMQVRANIPGNQAALILQYLQENSGR